MTGNGWPHGWNHAPSAGADALLVQLHELEIEDGRRRRLLLLAATAAVALHALLLVLVPRPAAETIAIPIVLREPFEVAPTPRMVEPPPASVPPRIDRSSRIVPVPDPTPDAPEPDDRMVDSPLPPLATPIDTELGTLPSAPPAAGAESELFVVDGRDVLPPIRRFAPDPLYPRAALVIRREATVVLEAVIDAQGAVTALRPLTRHGLGFEESALAAVRTWRFEPATRAGRPVPVRYQLSVRFAIAD